MRVALCLGLLCPSLLAAQDQPAAVRRAVDSLLATPDVEVAIGGLAELFVSHFFTLVPDLPAEDQAVLAEAAETAFRPSGVRDYAADKLASEVPPTLVTQLLDMRRSGAQAELGRLAAAHTPAQSLDDFVATLGTESRGRLQLMARLAEAEGTGEFDLLLDEAVRRATYGLFNSLGGGAAFEPMPDETFDAVYRQRIVSRALELLHRLEPAPDELIESVVAEYTSESAESYVNSYYAAMLEAVQVAGELVVELTASAPGEPQPDPADAGIPCRAKTCGFLVEWRGGAPAGFDRRFGDAGVLEARVLALLVAQGYRMERGLRDEGVTMRLRARTRSLNCEVVSGTGNTLCTAIDDVRVDYLGSDADFEAPAGFALRNECGADGALNVDDFATLVAQRLHHELAALPGDEPRPPSC